MNAQSKVEAATGLDLLRQEFPPHQISKLPKETKSQTEQRKKDMANGVWPAKCAICDGFHHPKAVHLDYVGHAALTDRLLDCDPHWTWEPMGTTPEGLPALNGGLWIKLTVCGVSRYGYGAADGKQGGDAIKEMIGDALRNAAMRFGAALDLWHKGDLHVEDDDGGATTGKPGLVSDGQLAVLQGYADGGVIDAARFCKFFQIPSLKDLPSSKYDEALGMAQAKLAKARETEPVQ